MSRIDKTELLATTFAFNYFSTSLSRVKYDDIEKVFSKDQVEEVYKKESIIPKAIFNDKFLLKILAEKHSSNKSEIRLRGWERTILIIGTDIANKSLNFIPTNDELIEKIEEELGLYTLERHNINILNKYKRLADYYYSEKLDKRQSFKGMKFNDLLHKKLTFEERLFMLEHFYLKEDILNVLRKYLNFKRFPSLFHELSAHLLKHGFIDAIVNLNFDELLDNALEDELGKDGFRRIVTENDFRDYNELIDDHKFKLPLYIKPRGTIGSNNSLLIDEHQRIDISDKIKELLVNVIGGALSEGSKPVRNINIIMAGSAGNDFDLSSILYNQNKNIDSNRSIHFFLLNCPLEFNENNRESNIEQSRNANIEKHEFNSTNPAEILKDAYLRIIDGSEENKIFNPPFIPQGINQHLLLDIIFPSKMFEGAYKRFKNKNILDTEWPKFFTEYLALRTKFHILYVLLKFDGRIELPTLIDGQAGKYFHLYRNRVKNPESSCVSIIDFIPELKLELIEDSDIIYICPAITKRRSKEEKIKFIARKLVENCCVGSYGEHGELYQKILHLINQIHNTKANNIYVKDSSKLLAFNFIKPQQMIQTNLAFTHKFYEFAVFNMDKWKSVQGVTYTGKSILNLFRLCTDFIGGKRHLERIFGNGNNINLIVCDEKSDIKDELKNIADDNPPGTLIFECIDSKFIGQDRHIMYIFYEDPDFKHPIYGLYQFKEFGENKIYPVFFDITDTNLHKNEMSKLNCKRNLEILVKLFKFHKKQIKLD